MPMLHAAYFILAIVAVIIATTRRSTEPVLALILAAAGFGVACGMSVGQIGKSFGTGFGAEAAGPGLAVLAAAFIGSMAEVGRRGTVAGRMVCPPPWPRGLHHPARRPGGGHRRVTRIRLRRVTPGRRRQRVEPGAAGSGAGSGAGAPAALASHGCSDHHPGRRLASGSGDRPALRGLPRRCWQVRSNSFHPHHCDRPTIPLQAWPRSHEASPLPASPPSASPWCAF